MKIHQHIEHIELEMLNQQLGAPPRAPHCRRGTIILGSALVLVSVSVCLFFFFFFRTLCVQDICRTPTDDGKVNITCRIQDTKGKRLCEIFQAEKSGDYSIHGWLNMTTNAEETVKLVHKHNGQERTLEKKISSGLMYFNTKVKLHNSSRVHLQFHNLLDTDGFFYIYEVKSHLDLGISVQVYNI
uniref:Immunoglobulin V-set domain-containing protein n=1 Tax=Knipowitschia caucasica TaxID=637954 RepID=A0AAV2KXX4_KNICA